MAKKLNKNVLIGLSLAAFVVMVGLSVVMINQLKKSNPVELREVAEQHRDSGDFDLAGRFYDQAYLASKDPMDLVHRGDMLELEGNHLRAYECWQRAATHDPSLLVAHRKMIDLAFEMSQLGHSVGIWSRLQESAEGLLKQNPDSDFGLHARGWALFNLESIDPANRDRGIEDMERAVELAPSTLDYQLNLASAYARMAGHAQASRNEPAVQKWKDKEAAIYDALLDTFPDKGAEGAEARWSYAQYLASKTGADATQLDEADKLYRQAIDFAGEDAQAYVESRSQYARFLRARASLVERGRVHGHDPAELRRKAEDLLLEARKKNPQHNEPVFGLAELYKSERRYDDVVALAQERLSQNIDRSGIFGRRNQEYLVRLLVVASESAVLLAVQAGQDDDHVARQRWLDNPDYAAGSGGQSESSRSAGDNRPGALQFIELAEQEIPAHAMVLAQKGQVLWLLGDDAGAIQHLDEAHRTYRGPHTTEWFWSLEKGLAKAYLRANKSGAALSVLKPLAREAEIIRGNDVEFWVLLAQALYDNQNYAEAIAITDDVLRNVPESNGAQQRGRAARIKIAALQKLERWDEAAAEAELTGTKFTDQSQLSAIFRAEVLAQDGKLDEAIDLMRAEVEQDPGNERMVTTLVTALLRASQIREREGNTERAEQFRQMASDALVTAISVNPDSDKLKRWELQAREGMSPEERDKALLEIINEEPDAYVRQRQLADFYYTRRADNEANIEKSLEHLLEAERLLREPDPAKQTLAVRNASNAEYRQLLTRKLATGALLTNAKEKERIMQEAVRAATAANIDAADGKTFVGQYHMLLEQVDAAIAAFTDAVRRQPTDSRTLAFLGRCYEAKSKDKSLQSEARSWADEARAAYTRAIDANPDEVLAHVGLAKLARSEAEFEQHMASCERLIAKAPNDPWLRRQLHARADMRDPAAGAKRREAALPDNPTTEHFDDVATLARLYEKLYLEADDSEQVAQYLEKADRYNDMALDLAEERVQLVFMSVAKYYVRTGRPEKSLAVCKRYIDQVSADPKSQPSDKANAYIALAGHYVDTQQEVEVEAVLLEGAAIAETFEICRSLGDYYMRINAPHKALPWLDKAVRNAPVQSTGQISETLVRRIDCLLSPRVNDLDQAEQRVKEFQSEYPDEAAGYYYLSEIQTQKGDIAGALRLLTEYLSRVPANQTALLQRAKLHLRSGAAAQAIADLESLKAAYPDTVSSKMIEARHLLAQQYRLRGDNAAWIAEMESLGKLAPDNEDVQFALARAYINAEMHAKASQLAANRINARKQQPDPGWFVVRGTIAAAEENFGRAIQAYKRAAELSNYTPQSVGNVMDMCMRAGRHDEGMDFYLEHRNPGEPSSQLMVRHAQLLAAKGEKSSAIEVFRDALAAAYEETTFATAVALAAIQRTFPPEDSIALFEDGPQTGAAARINERILARLHATLRHRDIAPTKYEQLIATAPHDEDRSLLHFELGQMYSQLDMHAEARQEYESAVKYDDTNASALNNLAYLLSEKLGEHELALPHAERAVALSGDYNAYDTLGWIHVHLGDSKRGSGTDDYQKAIVALGHARILNPSDPLTLYHLGEAYRRSGEFINAAEILRQGAAQARAANRSDLAQTIARAVDKANQQVATP